MVWPVEYPCSLPRLKLQTWDKDILSPDDVIAEAVINLRSFFAKAYKSKNGKSTWEIPKQFIAMYHPNTEGVQGRVEVQIDLLTVEEALSKPVGKGREDPNQYPVLPPPERPETSFSPFRPDQYVKQVFWKKYRGKIMCCGVILVLLILLHT